ncbi:hypothetical protein CLV56_0265 [Mumia flava]|uniref:Polyketide cyclase/dehydrase/lipid transport protein n=1 Tax=Mumia flava TaxID=1348852 RepID=A0A2M9BDN1_9ACTN|nr:polyketide cyclase / dehydrase and lipid transport [Mumia flava]PJJ56061.1 hypothetical protein CLV56_0265 [Mumia flava]
MPLVDVVDQTYVAVGPERLRARLCDEVALAAVLGPGLAVRCFEDRGRRGKRWRLSGALDGTAEVWLEELAEGTVVHVFVQADPSRSPRSARARRRVEERYHQALSRWVTSVRDELDGSRPVGAAPVPRAGRAAPAPASGTGPERDSVAARSERAGGLDDQPDDE